MATARYRTRKYPRTTLTDKGIPIRKLFIGNLTDSTTWTQLNDFFSAYGKVERCSLRESKKKESIAFVTFETAEDALKARQNTFWKTNMKRLNGRILHVDAAYEQSEDPESDEDTKASYFCDECCKTYYDVIDCPVCPPEP